MILSLLLFIIVSINAQQQDIKEIKTKRATPTVLIIHSSKFMIDDVVFSYFFESGKAYLSGMNEIKDSAYIKNGFVFSSYNKSEVEHGITAASGNVHGEPVFLGIQREGKLYELIPVDLKTDYDFSTPATEIIAQNLALYRMTNAIIGNELDVIINEPAWFAAYDALCPHLGVSTIEVERAIVGQGVNIFLSKPSLYKTSKKEIIKGNGSFYQYNTYTPYYKIGAGDPQLGEVVIRYTVIPFSGCSNQEPIIYDCVIKFPKEEPVTVRQYSKKKFWKAVKTHLIINRDGDKVIVNYDNTQAVNFDFPELTFILYSLPHIRELDRVETTDAHPVNVVLTVPKRKKAGYVKVIATEHGDWQNIMIGK